jgi:hypothetical protein
VCDAFGAGYWYIPGTDTCISVSGSVSFETFFHDDKYVGDSDDSDNDTEHTGSWNFVTSFTATVEAKSMTDWGPLTGYIAFTGDSDNTQDDPSGPHDVDRTVFVDEAYVALGPLLAGYTGSAYDHGGGYAYQDLKLSDTDADQVQLSWAISGFGLILALEDPRDRWGSSETNDIPDLVAAVTASGAGWDAKLSFMYGDTLGQESWGVQGGVEIAVWGNDHLKLVAEYSETMGSDLVEVLASFEHYWTANFKSAVDFKWDDTDAWAASFSTSFMPADGVELGAGFTTTDTDAWEAVLFIERTFGPNG